MWNSAKDSVFDLENALNKNIKVHLVNNKESNIVNIFL